jgi:hypothetical protein
VTIPRQPGAAPSGHGARRARNGAAAMQAGARSLEFGARSSPPETRCVRRGARPSRRRTRFSRHAAATTRRGTGRARPDAAAMRRGAAREARRTWMPKLDRTSQRRVSRHRRREPRPWCMGTATDNKKAASLRLEGLCKRNGTAGATPLSPPARAHAW